MMAACPKCKNRITGLSMELCDVCNDEIRIIESYRCYCPSCGHVFGMDRYYTYDRDEIVEGKVCGSN
jgi:uncharacterized protein with PIN domain